MALWTFRREPLAKSTKKTRRAHDLHHNTPLACSPLRDGSLAIQTWKTVTDWGGTVIAQQCGSFRFTAAFLRNTTTSESLPYEVFELDPDDFVLVFFLNKTPSCSIADVRDSDPPLQTRVPNPLSIHHNSVWHPWLPCVLRLKQPHTMLEMTC